MATTISDEVGYWELNLVENENMQTGVGYKFLFSGDNINIRYDKLVPNEIEKNFLALENL